VIRYGTSLDRMRSKARNIRFLDQAGVEIGSHTVRHSHTREWSREQWLHSFSDFQRILDLHGLPKPLGFRAPFLEWNEHLYPVMEQYQMTYDTSKTGGGRWPRRAPGTNIWVFGIPSVRIPHRERPALYFDLNMKTLLRRAAEAEGLSEEPDVRRYMNEQYFQAGMRLFNRSYRGNRVPVLISGHGNFRGPIIRIMRQVCNRPQVRCATFREAAEYMNQHPEMEGVRR
jgi:peptidoglycan/xylan/chitin deacetylase (PgdA/CDA1 family)